MVSKASSILILASLFALVFCGMSLSMQGGMSSHMASCPLMQGGASMCSMNPIEHMAALQNLFAATVPSAVSLMLLLALFAYAFFEKGFDADIGSAKLAASFEFEVPTFSFLRHAFSRGILHSKAY